MAHKGAPVFARRILVLVLCILAGTVVGAPSTYENLSFGKLMPVNHYCVWQESKIFCAGENSAGQVSNLPAGYIPGLVETASFAHSAVKKVVAGERNFCVLLENGSIWCWGDGYYGQLGTGTVDSRSLPHVLRTPEAELFTDLDAGRDHACAIAEEGKEIQCWGYGIFGQVGERERETNTVPQPVPFPDGVEIATGLGLGGHHACVVFENQSVACWGNGHEGQLGSGQIRSTRPLSVVGLGGVGHLGGVGQVDAGYNFSCARQASGLAVHCWGNGDYGQLGYGKRESSTNPVAVQLDLPEGTTIVDIVLGSLHACMLLSDGEMRCWGYGIASQLGLDPADASRVSTPAQTPVPPGEAGASDYSCTRVDETTVVFCMRGTTETVTLELPRGTTITQFPADNFSSCALVKKCDLSCPSSNPETTLADQERCFGVADDRLSGLSDAGFSCDRGSSETTCTTTAGMQEIQLPLNENEIETTVVQFPAPENPACAVTASQDPDDGGGYYCRPPSTGEEQSPNSDIDIAASANPLRVLKSDGSPYRFLKIAAGGFSSAGLSAESRQWLKWGEENFRPERLQYQSGNSLQIEQEGHSVFSLLSESEPKPDSVFLYAVSTGGDVIFEHNLRFAAGENVLTTILPETGVGYTLFVTVHDENMKVRIVTDLPYLEDAGTLSILTALQGDRYFHLKASRGPVVIREITVAEYKLELVSSTDQLPATGSTLQIHLIGTAGLQSTLKSGTNNLPVKSNQILRLDHESVDYYFAVKPVVGNEHYAFSVRLLPLTAAGKKSPYTSWCVLESEQVNCAGSNQSRQISSRRVSYFSGLIPVMDSTEVVATALGEDYMCILGGDGGIQCRGDNRSGQLAQPLQTTPLAEFVPVSLGDRRAIEVVAGTAHSCALISDGSVWCWGRGNYGELSGGTTVFSTPVRVQLRDDQPVVGLAAGSSHSCALMLDGELYCWGSNMEQQLGNAVVSAENAHPVFRLSVVPVRVGFGELRVEQIAAGSNHTCALANDRGVWCWGDGSAGQLGTGVLSDSPFPSRVPLPEDALAIAAGELHTCTLLDNGDVWCWGGNIFGETASAGMTISLFPTLVESLPEMVVGIAAGGRLSLATLSDGNYLLWGEARPLRKAGYELAALSVDDRARGFSLTIRASIPEAVVQQSSRLFTLEAVAGAGVPVSSEDVNWPAGSTSEDLKFTLPGSPASQGLDRIFFDSEPLRLSLVGGRYFAGAKLELSGENQVRLTHELSSIIVGDVPSSIRDRVVVAGPKIDTTVTVYLATSRATIASSPLRSAKIKSTATVAEVVLEYSIELSAVGNQADPEYIWYCVGEEPQRDCVQALRVYTLATPPKVNETRTGLSEDRYFILRVDTATVTLEEIMAGEYASRDKSVSPEATTGTMLLHLISSHRETTFTVTLDKGSDISVNKSYWVHSMEVPFRSSHLLSIRPGDKDSDYALTARLLPAITVGRDATARQTLAVDAGRTHFCVQHSTARAYCSGANEFRQIADLGAQFLPALVQSEFVESQSTPIVSVVAGGGHNCLLLGNGEIQCQGRIRPAGNALESTTIALPERAVDVALGRNHGCALGVSGRIHCWGSNDLGQLGDLLSNSDTQNFSPTLPQMMSFTSVSAGDSHSCALSLVGSVYCWGTFASTSSEVLFSSVTVTIAREVKDITSGGDHACALTSGNQILCWGSDVRGDLPRDFATQGPLIPAVVVFPTETGKVQAIQVVAGAAHTCSLTTAGDTWCWGANEQGQLGDGRRLTRPGPVKVVYSDEEGFTMIAAGGERSAGVLSGGEVLIWGEGIPYPVLANYQLASTTVGDVSVPGALTFTLPVNALSAEGLRALVVNANGEILSDRPVVDGQRPLFAFPHGAEGQFPFHLVLSAGRPINGAGSDSRYELEDRQSAPGVSLRVILQGAYRKQDSP